MADAIKISDLPDVSSFGSEDLFVVNDITSADEVTSKVSVGYLVGWIQEQDLNFTGTLVMKEIVPGLEGLDITVNSIHIEDNITIDPYAVVEGIELNDLDDVDIDTGVLIDQQVLQWQESEQRWKNGTVVIETNDHTGDIIEINKRLDIHQAEITALYGMITNLSGAQIEEAPMNDLRYVRINGTWQETDYLRPDGGGVDVIPPIPPVGSKEIGTPSINRISSGDIVPGVFQTFEVSAPGMNNVSPLLIQWNTIPAADIQNANNYRADITFPTEGSYVVSCILRSSDPEVTDSPRETNITVSAADVNDPNSLDSMFDRTYNSNAITSYSSHVNYSMLRAAWTEAQDFFDTMFKVKPEVVEKVRAVDPNFNGIRFDYTLDPDAGTANMGFKEFIYLNHDDLNLGSVFAFVGDTRWDPDFNSPNSGLNYGGYVEVCIHEICHLLGVTTWFMIFDQAHEWWGDRPSWHKPFHSGQAQFNNWDNNGTDKKFITSPGFKLARDGYVGDGGSTGGIPVLAAANDPNFAAGNTGFAHWAGKRLAGSESYVALNTDQMSYGTKIWNGFGPGNVIGGASWGFVMDTGNYISLSGPEGSSINDYRALASRNVSTDFIEFECGTGKQILTHDVTAHSVEPVTGVVTTSVITESIRQSRNAQPLTT